MQAVGSGETTSPKPAAGSGLRSRTRRKADLNEPTGLGFRVYSCGSLSLTILQILKASPSPSKNPIKL